MYQSKFTATEAVNVGAIAVGDEQRAHSSEQKIVKNAQNIRISTAQSLWAHGLLGFRRVPNINDIQNR